MKNEVCTNKISAAKKAIETINEAIEKEKKVNAALISGYRNKVIEFTADDVIESYSLTVKRLEHIIDSQMELLILLEEGIDLARETRDEALTVAKETLSLAKDGAEVARESVLKNEKMVSGLLKLRDSLDSLNPFSFIKHLFTNKK